METALSAAPAARAAQQGSGGVPCSPKNSVTGMFSAQVLWAAGYLGQGVKMGVFDTGIREDHPHVKNIKCACPISGWLETLLAPNLYSTTARGEAGPCMQLQTAKALLLLASPFHAPALHAP